MSVARIDLRRAAAGAAAAGADGQGGRGRRPQDQGYPGKRSLHGRTAADDRQRHFRHQRHRAGDRLATAPFARRVLRSRQRQDPLLRQAAVLGARHSLSRLLAGFRIRCQGHHVRPHRPPPQVAGHHPVAGAVRRAQPQQPSRAQRQRTDSRDLLRHQHGSDQRRTVQPGPGAGTPAGRNRQLRHPHRRPDAAGGRPAHQGQARPRTGQGRRAKPAHPARISGRQNPGPRPARAGHRRIARRGQRRTDHRQAGENPGQRRSPNSRRCTSTTSTVAPTSPTPCAPTLPAASGTPRSKSTG